MNAIQEMLKAHPHPAVMGRGVDMGLLSQTASELFDCAQACTACADACVGEIRCRNSSDVFGCAWIARTSARRQAGSFRARPNRT